MRKVSLLYISTLFTLTLGCSENVQVVGLTSEFNLTYFRDAHCPYSINSSTSLIVEGHIEGLFVTNGWIYGYQAQKGIQISKGYFVLNKTNFVHGLTRKEMENFAKTGQGINGLFNLEDPSFYLQ